MCTNTTVRVCYDNYIKEPLRNPSEKKDKKVEDPLELTTETGVTQNQAETGSLVAKNSALNELVLLDNEDHLRPQIDCSGLFVLIGLILIELHGLNLIVKNLIV